MIKLVDTRKENYQETDKRDILFDRMNPLTKTRQKLHMFYTKIYLMNIIKFKNSIKRNPMSSHTKNNLVKCNIFENKNKFTGKNKIYFEKTKKHIEICCTCKNLIS